MDTILVTLFNGCPLLLSQRENQCAVAQGFPCRVSSDVMTHGSTGGDIDIDPSCELWIFELWQPILWVVNFWTLTLDIDCCLANQGIDHYSAWPDSNQFERIASNNFLIVRHTHTYTHIYMYTYIHIYIHTYIHLHMENTAQIDSCEKPYCKRNPC